jgi:hypothetical protein
MTGHGLEQRINRMLAAIESRRRALASIKAERERQAQDIKVFLPIKNGQPRKAHRRGAIGFYVAQASLWTDQDQDDQDTPESEIA